MMLLDGLPPGLVLAAFLPQFIDPAVSPMSCSVTLGGVFILVAAGTDSAYVFLAASLAHILWRTQGVPCVGRTAGP